MVSQPSDVGSKTVATATAPPASTPERGAPPPSSAAAAVDRVDIKPLDVSAALQILLAEVREAFTLLLIEASSTTTVAGASDPAIVAAPAEGANPGTLANLVNATPGNPVNVGMTAAVGHVLPTTLDGPVPAARALVEIVLQSLPETLEENVWSEALPRAEAALQTGVQRAIDAVSAWRDVAPVVVETTQASARLALNVLGDEPQNPLWLQSEWLALAPRLTRFWRRRRVFRRRLKDPDYDAATEWDRSDDFTP